MGMAALQPIEGGVRAISMMRAAVILRRGPKDPSSSAANGSFAGLRGQRALDRPADAKDDDVE